MNIYIGKFILLCSLLLSNAAFARVVKNEPPNKSVVIYGELLNWEKTDQVILQIVKETFNKSIDDSSEYFFYATPRYGGLLDGVKPGTQLFWFQLNLPSPHSYLTLKTQAVTIFENFLFSQGDSVKISVDARTRQTTYAGPSKWKFICQQELDGLIKSDIAEEPFVLNLSSILSKEEFLESKNNSETIAATNERFGKKVEAFAPGTDQLERMKKMASCLLSADVLNRIDSYSDRLGTDIRNILKCNYIGGQYARLSRSFQHYHYPQMLQLKNPTALAAFQQFYLDQIQPLPTDRFSEEIVLNAPQYLEFLLNKASATAKVNNYSVYDVLRNTYKGVIRDKLVSNLLLGDARRKVGNEKMVEDAMMYVIDDRSRRLLESLDTRFKNGVEAFKFELPDRSGNLIRLNDFKGKVVLADLWFTGCTACIGYKSRIVQPLLDSLKGKDFVVISISVDKDSTLWIKSLEGGKYSNDGSLNVYTGGLGGNHPFVKYYNFHAFPSALLIDKQGRLVTDVNLYPNTPENLLERIQSLLSVNE